MPMSAITPRMKCSRATIRRLVFCFVPVKGKRWWNTLSAIWTTTSLFRRTSYSFPTAGSWSNLSWTSAEINHKMSCSENNVAFTATIPIPPLNDAYQGQNFYFIWIYGICLMRNIWPEQSWGTQITIERLIWKVLNWNGGKEKESSPSVRFRFLVQDSFLSGRACRISEWILHKNRPKHLIIWHLSPIFATYNIFTN